MINVMECEEWKIDIHIINTNGFVIDIHHTLGIVCENVFFFYTHSIVVIWNVHICATAIYFLIL